MIHLFEVSKIIAINYVKINNYIFNSDPFSVSKNITSPFVHLLSYSSFQILERLSYRIHCLFNDEAIRMIHSPLFC